ncbi:MAG: phenylalanine 4-monooxygenase [Draconibacterium sp.]|nr:MAG: phenylalanine 4-monooxygenase [Draconibacterium sp.]PIF05046.1 MAG: phenylalanine 4-monooxygenase [Draconibacterium sp.]
MLPFLQKIQSGILKLIDSIYFPFLHFIPPVIFRYGVTGGANTLFDLLLYFIIYNYALHKQIVDIGIIAISPHIAAFLIVFPITFTSGFLLAKYITFTQSGLRGRIQLFRYGLSVGGAILLNYFFLKLFVEQFGWYATFSKAATTVIVIVYSYLIQRYFSFRTGNPEARQNVAG